MLQPIKKSFSWYIVKWYEYWSWKKLTEKKLINLVNKIHLLDDSILILDDILDWSEIRNNKPCLYKEIGTSKAIVHSELLKTKCLNIFFDLFKILWLKSEQKVIILQFINQYLNAIYSWESIDIELTNWKNNTKIMIDKYFQMVSLFTWWHIKYGLEIGQLLSGKEIDKYVSEIAIYLGIIRQIYDDFNDYFSLHHEPFWDFKSGNNRLPEILFKKMWWNRKYVLNLIIKNKLSLAKEVVLNKEVRKELFEYCKIYEDKIKSIKTLFNYENMLEWFDDILSKK